MIADISVNQLKQISKSTSALLRWESINIAEYYYVNKGPVIFRTVIKKDQSTKFSAFLQQINMPVNIQIKNRLRDSSEELVQLRKRVDQIASDAERQRALDRNKI